jgi:hypothetical protein
MEETLARRVFQGLNGNVALRCPHQVGEFFVPSAECGRACLKFSGILHTRHNSREIPALETYHCYFPTTIFYFNISVFINNSSVVRGGRYEGHSMNPSRIGPNKSTFHPDKCRI